MGTLLCNKLTVFRLLLSTLHSLLSTLHVHSLLSTLHSPLATFYFLLSILNSLQDGGHQVHQVSEELKNEVSAEAHAKAREMAEEAFQQRLQDIDLGQAENDTYDAYFGRVKSQVAQLQNVLENVRVRRRRRLYVWVCVVPSTLSCHSFLCSVCLFSLIFLPSFSLLLPCFFPSSSPFSKTHSPTGTCQRKNLVETHDVWGIGRFQNCRRCRGGTKRLQTQRFRDQFTRHPSKTTQTIAVCV